MVYFFGSRRILVTYKPGVIVQGTPPFTPNFTVPQSSRVAVAQGYDSNSDASTITLLTNNARTATVLTSVTSSAANEVHTIGWKTAGAITGKGAIIYMGCATAIPDTILQSVVIEESFNATNLTDGTWTPISFTPVKPLGESSSTTLGTRGQYALVNAGPARIIRVTSTKDNNTTARVIRFGLYQRPAQGIPDDIVLMSGPSLMSPQNAITHNLNLSAITTGRDPIVINRARAGAVAVNVVEESIVDALMAHPDTATVILDIGGNDITNNRPYTSDQQHLPNALAQVLTIMKNNPNIVFYLHGVSFRNYPVDGAKPAIEGVLHPEYGSKPYNDNQVYPWISSSMLWAWDEELGVPKIDIYSAWLDTYETSIGGDGIHGITAGYNIYRQEGAYAYKHRAGQLWSDGYVKRRIISFEVAATITAAQKARLQAVIDQWPVAQNSSQTTARNALISRLNAITVSG